jgi:hypothetical protein
MGTRLDGPERRKGERGVDTQVVDMDAFFFALRRHMDNEEVHSAQQSLQRQKDVDEIKERLAPLDKIIESMPRNEQGKPSCYLHRVQHEELSSSYRKIGRFKNGFWVKAGEMTFLALLILAANGQLAKWAAALLPATGHGP